MNEEDFPANLKDATMARSHLCLFIFLLVFSSSSRRFYMPQCRSISLVGIRNVPNVHIIKERPGLIPVHTSSNALTPGITYRGTSSLWESEKTRRARNVYKKAKKNTLGFLFFIVYEISSS